MSGWIDDKYVMMLQPKLEGFTLKRRSPIVVNCRCPLCGDSKKSRTKKRGYFYGRGAGVFYSCKNCGESTTLKSMLWRLDRRLYDEYQVESFVNAPERTEIAPASTLEAVLVLSDDDCEVKLLKLSMLDDEHPARRYLKKRLVPESKLDRVYWTDAFYDYVNTMIPGKFDDKALKRDKGRVVFPFTTRDGKIYGCSGRAIDDDSLRYISVKWVEEIPKSFGMDRVDWGREIRAFEGQIDSLFVDNAMAVAGGDVHSLDLPLDRTVFCWDNEPRNREVVRMVDRAIERGLRVFLWPENWWGLGKDINDLVLSGVGPAEIDRIISECSCSGMLAQMRFNQWKKA
jgi:hypothetical protein